MQSERRRRAKVRRPRAEQHLAPLSVSLTLGIAACFFLSGFSALVYEITWIRKASLVFGTTTFALTTVLATYFAGLALGSYAFGRASQKMSQPLRVYALLEIAIGLLAIVSPASFKFADYAYGLLYPHILESPTLSALIRFALTSLIVLPPTILMGATLPLMCRYFVQSKKRISLTVGTLYGVNTLGAAFGAGCCGFLMIPTIGVNRSIYIAAAINIAIGVIIRQLRIRPLPRETDASDDSRTPSTPLHPSLDPHAGDSPPAAARTVYALFLLIGFVALAQQVLWARFLSLVIYNTVHTYTLTLVLVLVGIAVGSLSTGWLLDRFSRRSLLFGATQIFNGLVVLLVMMLPAQWWEGTLGVGREPSRLYACALIMLLPALVSGVAFPLATRMVLDNPRLAGITVGRLSAINTLGGIAGSVVAGFYLIPLVGLHKSVLLTTGMSLGIGYLAWLLVDRTVLLRTKLLLAMMSLAAWAAIPAGIGTRLPDDFLAHGDRLLAVREGRACHLAVLERDDTLRLEIDKMWQGGNRKNHQIMAAHVPMLLHTNPKSVLALGMGTGQTFSRFLMYDIERLDCVEIEPELVGLLKAHYDSAWMEDPRVRVIIEDGRHFVAHSNNTYDVISVAVGQTFRSGVASFYTSEFYRAAARRLNDGGIICQFVPLPSFAVEEFRGIVNTFIDVFPESVLWYNTVEFLLIGSRDERIRLTPSRLALLESHAEIHADMEYSYWGGPAEWLNRREVFLAGFLMDAAGLADAVRGVHVYTDDVPRLEYSTATSASRRNTWRLDVLPLVREHLADIRSISLSRTDDETLRAAGVLREKNLNNVVTAGLLRAARTKLLQGSPAKSVGLLQEAVRMNPDNVGARCGLADAMYKLRKLDAAATHYSHALRVDPESARAHMRLGLVMADVGRIDDAMAHYTAAIRIKPDYAEAHTNLGNALLGRREFAEAMTHYTESLRLAPSAQAQSNLGVVLAAAGQFEQARSAFRKSVQLNPGFRDGHVNLGNALTALGRFEQALEYFMIADGLKSDPGVRENMADVLIQLDRPGEAMEHYRGALKLKRGQPEVMAKLAWLLATSPVDALRSATQAVALAERARHLTGGSSFSVLRSLAAAYAEAGRFNKAVVTARRAIDVAAEKGRPDVEGSLRAQLERYESHLPFRDHRPSRQTQ